MIKQKTAVAAIPVTDWGKDNLDKGLEAGIPINKGGVFVLFRDFVDETLHQPDRERNVEGGIEQDESKVGIAQSKCAVHQVNWDDNNDGRKHARAEDEEEQIFLACDFEA